MLSALRTAHMFQCPCPLDPHGTACCSFTESIICHGFSAHRQLLKSCPAFHSSSTCSVNSPWCRSQLPAQTTFSAHSFIHSALPKDTFISQAAGLGADEQRYLRQGPCSGWGVQETTSVLAGQTDKQTLPSDKWQESQHSTGWLYTTHPGSESWRCWLQAVWPSDNCLTFLCLSALICKMEIIRKQLGTGVYVAQW